jgi:hypothetical protein
MSAETGDGQNKRSIMISCVKQNKMDAVVSAGVFWGAIWGMYEASVGWLVHFLPRVPGTASIVLIPFAVYCMDRAFRGGGLALRAALIAAGTAASIKLINLFLPAHSLQTILNPAVSILLQGLAFAAVARGLGLARRFPSFKAAALGALLFSTGWRMLFLLYSAVLAWGWSLGMLRDGLHTPWGFMVRDSLLSAAAVLAVMGLIHRRKRVLEAASLPAPGRMAVAAVVVLAVGMQLLLNR